MSARVDECARLGGWVIRGCIPPFPPGEAPEGKHVDGECKLCGEREFNVLDRINGGALPPTKETDHG